MSQVEDSLPGTSQDAQMAALMELVRAKGVAWATERLTADCPPDSGIVTSIPPSGQDPEEETGGARTKRVRRATNKDFPPNPPPGQGPSHRHFQNGRYFCANYPACSSNSGTRGVPSRSLPEHGLCHQK